MADEPNFFRRQAVEEMSSPDDLDKYLRVTNPSVWISLLAVIFLLAGLFAWAALGTINTSITTSAVRIGDKVMTFASNDQTDEITAGDDVYVGNVSGRVANVQEFPYSKDEVRMILGNDYLTETLMKDNWAHMVTIEVDDPQAIKENVPVKCVITTERVSPLKMMTNERAQ